MLRKDLGDRILLANAVEISLIFSRGSSKTRQIGPSDNPVVSWLGVEESQENSHNFLPYYTQGCLRFSLLLRLFYSNHAETLLNDQEHLR